MRPDPRHQIYFSERFDDALQHGADVKRGASFAFKAMVAIPAGASMSRTSRPGNPVAVVVTTTQPLPTRIIELYVRLGRAPRFELETIKGIEQIKKYLTRTKAAGSA